METPSTLGLMKLKTLAATLNEIVAGYELAMQANAQLVVHNQALQGENEQLKKKYEPDEKPENVQALHNED